MKRIVIFASGRGSNADALYRAMRDGEIQGKLCAVVSDVPEAPVLEKAALWGVRAHCIDPTEYPSKQIYEFALLELLARYQPDLIVLAGFMRLLGPAIIEAYPHRIMNIHPALLPSFPGLHAQQQAVDAGVKVSGCTVHFVDTGMDTGPIILQAAVPVGDTDTGESLAARILVQEHETYKRAVALFCEDKLEVIGKKVVRL